MRKSAATPADHADRVHHKEGNTIRKKLTALLPCVLLLFPSSCSSGTGQQEHSSSPNDRQQSADNSKSLVDELGLTAEAKAASPYTVAVNSALYSLLYFENSSEYENATRGLIDAPEVLELTDAAGNVIWSQAAMQLVEKNLGEREIRAVIISHPHVDHYGGIRSPPPMRLHRPAKHFVSTALKWSFSSLPARKPPAR